jgi:hypothetical protein
VTINLTSARYESGFIEATSYDVLATDSAAGALHRRQRSPQPRRAWTLSYRILDATELTAFLSEFDTAKGSAGEILFRPPGFARDLTVRLAEGSFNCVKIGNGPHYQVTFQVVSDVLI